MIISNQTFHTYSSFLIMADVRLAPGVHLAPSPLHCVKINQLIWLRTLGEEACDSTALRQKFRTFHDVSIKRRR